MVRTFHRPQTLALVAILTAAFTVVNNPDRAQGQFFNNRGAVGGVSIDAMGVVSAPSIQQQQQLEQLRQQALEQPPADLQAFTKLRAVSLKQLDAAIAEHRSQSGANDNSPLPDELQFLAGLQRVEFVFVYPQRNDVILAGPAEGWRMDALGNVVGATTGRPVLLLDDLMAAFRARGASRLEPISCSIDPTPEGLRRLQAHARGLRTIGNPEATAAGIERAVGQQTVSVAGVPGWSHFARSLVAADFRMKRLAMNIEPAPIEGMPSYLHLMKAGGHGMQSTLPRWWLAPMYEPIATDGRQQAWHLRGQGVQCLTQSDFVNAQGQIERRDVQGKTAAAWAKIMTERFDELCAHDSAFGHLRNIMDLAVVGALLERYALLDVAQLELPNILEAESMIRYPAPRPLATTASLMKKGRNWIISASGGVQIQPWSIIERIEKVGSLGVIHGQMADTSGRLWWE
jgi:uncharacterized protein DUF1598